jgi:hypothetical protein
VCVAGIAVAAPDKKKPEVPDVKANAAKLEVWKDDLNQFYVVPQYDAFKFEDAGLWVFFGDAKNLYQQRIIGAGVQNSAYSWTVWSPRVASGATATIQSSDKGMTVTCGRKDVRTMTQLKADEAKAFFAKATFGRPLWHRQPRFIARDDDGVYYFVDMLDDEAGSNGFRMFVGMKGTMKELTMTNVIEDSAGQIYASKSGNLKIVVSEKTDTAFWVKGGKKTELTVLAPLENRYLIYRGLGIYGQLGVVCDDL